MIQIDLQYNYCKSLSLRTKTILIITFIQTQRFVNKNKFVCLNKIQIMNDYYRVSHFFFFVLYFIQLQEVFYQFKIHV